MKIAFHLIQLLFLLWEYELDKYPHISFSSTFVPPGKINSSFEETGTGGKKGTSLWQIKDFFKKGKFLSRRTDQVVKDEVLNRLL